MQTDTQKLRVLRARTDHDLLALVQREVERGLNAVELATSKSCQLYAQARKSYETATMLLSRVANSIGDDRLRIEGQLMELGHRLKQLPAFVALASFPASFAS